MTRKRLAVFTVVAALTVNVVLFAVQAGFAGPGNLGAYLFGPRMVRLEAVMQEAGASHDYRLDRGRLRNGAAGSLTILELDGSLQTIAVAPDAQVTVDGRPASFAQLRRGMKLLVVREDDAPANRVQAESKQ